MLLLSLLLPLLPLLLPRPSRLLVLLRNLPAYSLSAGSDHRGHHAFFAPSFPVPAVSTHGYAVVALPFVTATATDYPTSRTR